MNTHNDHKRTFWGIRGDVFVCLLLFILTLSVYWQVNNHAFINFDDDVYVTDNHNVQAGLTLEGLKFAFSFVERTYWHPLTWLSHMLDCQLFGLNAGLHHLMNLLFHMANSLLLFAILKRMSGALWQSAFVAALFALHPINVDSVAWVSERKNLLSTFFWLLTMLAYVRYTERPNFYKYTIVFVTLALGLLAKTMLVTLPFVFLLLDYWPLRRYRLAHSEVGNNEKADKFMLGSVKKSQTLGLILEKVPLLALSAGMINLSSSSVQEYGIVLSLESVSMKLRIANALVSYIKYLAKMIWPQRLAIYYPFPKIIPMWQTIAAFMLLVFISVLVIKALKRAPYLAVGWLWYLGTLVPVIGLIQAGLWPAMADRWAYVPLIGIFIMVAWGIPDLAARWHFKKTWLSLAAATVLSVFVVTTWLHVRIWADSITLFEHAIKVTTNNFVAHNNLGTALKEQGRIAEAIHHYQEALRLLPGYAKAHNNIGAVMENQGRIAEAILHYTEAVRIDPENALIHYNLGHVLGEQDRMAEAIGHYVKALQIKPDFADAYNNLGVALLRLGKITQAIDYLQEAVRLKPDAVAMQDNLKSALTAQEKSEKELSKLQAALQQKPVDAHLYYKMGELYKSNGRLDEAIAQFQKAIELKPKYFEALYNLAIIFALKGEYDQALELSEAMLSARPEDAAAHYFVACIYARKNRIEESLDWLKKAIEKGYQNWELIKTDKNLANIRKTDFFQDLVKNH
jgi:tetratricopeptide (TPR) repeat protein